MPNERVHHRNGGLLDEAVGAPSPGELDATTTRFQRHGPCPYLGQALEQRTLLKT